MVLFCYYFILTGRSTPSKQDHNSPHPRTFHSFTISFINFYLFTFKLLILLSFMKGSYCYTYYFCKVPYLAINYVSLFWKYGTSLDSLITFLIIYKYLF